MTLSARNGIQLVSLLAENADAFYGPLGAWLASSGIAIEADSSMSFSARKSLVKSGKPVLVALCSGLYVRRAAVDGLEALLTTVPVGARYENRPILYADVIVHRDNAARNLSELRHGVVAFNDSDSLSGHDAILDRLRTLNAGRSFFRHAIASGSHARSMELVRSRKVDAAAVDSLILDAALLERPSLGEELRVVDSLGPFPNHIFAVNAAVSAVEKKQLMKALMLMHESQEGRRILASGGFQSCMRTTDDFEEPIRRLVSRVADLALAPTSWGARSSLHAESSQ